MSIFRPLSDAVNFIYLNIIYLLHIFFYMYTLSLGLGQL